MICNENRIEIVCMTDLNKLTNEELDLKLADLERQRKIEKIKRLESPSKWPKSIAELAQMNPDDIKFSDVATKSTKIAGFLVFTLFSIMLLGAIFIFVMGHEAGPRSL